MTIFSKTTQKSKKTADRLEIKTRTRGKRKINIKLTKENADYARLFLSTIGRS
jgi:UPF0288 family protein (methanogenesis marker protein 3)